jgi:hypothetical protein
MTTPPTWPGIPGHGFADVGGLMCSVLLVVAVGDAAFPCVVADG